MALIDKQASIVSLKFTAVVFVLILLIGGLSLIKVLAICGVHFLLTQFAFKVEDGKDCN